MVRAATNSQLGEISTVYRGSHWSTVQWRPDANQSVSSAHEIMASQGNVIVHLRSVAPQNQSEKSLSA